MQPSARLLLLALAVVLALAWWGRPVGEPEIEEWTSETGILFWDPGPSCSIEFSDTGQHVTARCSCDTLWRAATEGPDDAAFMIAAAWLYDRACGPVTVEVEDGGP